MRFPRLLSLLLLAALVAVSACGKRGDPVRPGDEIRDEETGLEELF